jgi:hypothetical protein
VHGSMLAQTYGRPQIARSHGSSSDMTQQQMHPPDAMIDELTASVAGIVRREHTEVAVHHARLTADSGRNVLRAGSAPLRSGAVPKLNLSVLKS